jgi:DNA-binding PadR family transcriptional regulator
VWEDAVDRGLIEREVERRQDGSNDPLVSATAAGLDYLKRNGRQPKVAV